MNNHIVTRILLVLAVFLFLWVVVGPFLSLWGGDIFYRIEQPVPVLEVREDTVVLKFHRFALLPMDGMCARSLSCFAVEHFPAEPCPLMPGWTDVIRILPLTKTALNSGSGPCTYQGTVTFSPLGFLVPRMTEYWESEPFEAPRE